MHKKNCSFSNKIEENSLAETVSGNGKLNVNIIQQYYSKNSLSAGLLFDI